MKKQLNFRKKNLSSEPKSKVTFYFTHLLYYFNLSIEHFNLGIQQISVVMVSQSCMQHLRFTFICVSENTNGWLSVEHYEILTFDLCRETATTLCNTQLNIGLKTKLSNFGVFKYKAILSVVFGLIKTKNNVMFKEV